MAGILLSLPLAAKAIHAPSGEKYSCCTPSVPSRRCDCTSSNARTYTRTMPALSRAVKATRRATEEMSTEYEVAEMLAPSGCSIVSRIGAATDDVLLRAARHHPNPVALATIASSAATASMPREVRGRAAVAPVRAMVDWPSRPTRRCRGAHRWCVRPSLVLGSCTAECRDSGPFASCVVRPRFAQPMQSQSRRRVPSHRAEECSRA